MQLDESYEIIEFTQSEGVVVSKARDKKTGKLIQIHLFPNEKISEASQICARLLSLPGEARGKVLKYGQDGSSTYFITEPLPDGEPLAEWVLRAAAPRPSVKQPEVSGSAMGNLRQMGIEPAPLQPLPPGSEIRLTPEAPPPAPPAARPVRRVHPIPAPPAPSEPKVQEVGDFTRIYGRAELNRMAEQAAPHQEAARSSTALPPSSPAPAGFPQIYGRQDDWKLQEPAPGPAPLPATATPARAAEPGLETFIGIPKAARPPAAPIASAPPPAAAPPAAPARPAFTAPPIHAWERLSSPDVSARGAGDAFALDPPAPRVSAHESAELFTPPHASAPAPAPIAGQSAAAPAPRRVSEPLFSAKIAIMAALSLLAVAAIVVVLVEVLG